MTVEFQDKRRVQPAVSDEAQRLARLGSWRLARSDGTVAWSDEILELLGCGRGNAPGFAAALAAFPAQTQAELRQGLARTWETGDEVSIVGSLTRRDGGRREVLVRFRAEAVGAHGARTHISGIMLDVTEARSLDERLLREKALLQMALDHMDQGLLVVERDMSVPVLSRRAAEILCLPAAFAENPPSFPKILTYQVETGAISEELMHSGINRFILDLEDLQETHVYERDTFDGKSIEVRTTMLPDGGFVRSFTDATARKRREAEVARAEAQYRTLFENSVTGIYRLLGNGQVRANPALARLHGYETEAEFLAAARELGENGWYVQPGRRDEFHRVLKRDGRVTDFVSEVYRLRDRERFWISEAAWPIRDGHGAIVGYEGTAVDATERKRAEARIDHMARHDGLTGLPNRTEFSERLETALAQGPLAVLLIDLDRFKVVNDTMGHPAGDALLRALSERFASRLGPDQAIARLGGDEFAVLMPGAGCAAAVAMARDLLAAAREPVPVEGRPIVVGASIGIALAPSHGTDPTQLTKCADLALYRAKADGGDMFRRFAPEMDAAMQERQRLELDLRDALARREFRVLYQPVARVCDGAVVGYEALLRWSHPSRGDVPPETFIAIAEETRMIVPIGEWVLARACADAALLPGELEISVNVSTVQLGRPDFEERLERALAASGLAPQRLVLEITETALMDLRLDIAPLLGRLKARGIRTALDDFGTGYSSLGYLRRFAFDILKIDRSFTCALAEREAAAIVGAVLELGRRLGIATVAEGVETASQLAALRAAGCAYVQGHLLGEPRTLAEILGP